jgi:hypothetical protein
MEPRPALERGHGPCTYLAGIADAGRGGGVLGRSSDASIALARAKYLLASDSFCGSKRSVPFTRRLCAVHVGQAYLRQSMAAFGIHDAKVVQRLPAAQSRRALEVLDRPRSVNLNISACHTRRVQSSRLNACAMRVAPLVCIPPLP